MQTQISRTRLTGTAVLMGAMLVGGAAKATDPPEHLMLAEILAETIKPSTNDYGGPALVTWVGENGLKSSTVLATCSTFVALMFTRAYGIDFEAWLGTLRPSSACFHEVLVDEQGFTLIESVADVEPGDLLVIRYYDEGCKIHDCQNFSGCEFTGHTAMVAATPTQLESTSPVIEGTLQYTLKVLDVTKAVHGVGDTRWEANPDHSDDEGVGTGTMRLYVDADDPELAIVGYTWSTSKNSSYHPRSKRDVVIGRYQLVLDAEPSYPFEAP